MSQDSCILTTKDFTILEILLDRSVGMDDAVRSHLRRKLDEATVVFRDDIPPDVATLSSRISYRINVSETDSRILSHDTSSSPIGLFLPISTPRGLALLGMTEGQEVTLGAADGNLERLVLEKVLYQPEAARLEKEAMSRLTTPETRRAALRVVGSSATERSAKFKRVMEPTADDDDPGPSAA